jgi:cytosine/adenosine deaminase-related metal-dependent hydrolase
VLYRNGQVRSPVSPFATALLVQNGEIAWVGTEDAAEDMARAAAVVVDLADAWVAPGFVDAEVTVRAAATHPGDTPAQRWLLDEAARLGVVALHALSGHEWDSAADADALLRCAAERRGPAVRPYAAEPIQADSSGVLARVSDLGRFGVAATLRAATDAGQQVAFQADEDQDLDELAAGLLAAAEQLDPGRLVAGRHRVHGADRCPDPTLATLVRFGVAVVLRPTVATDGARYGALAAAGLPLAMTSAAARGPLDPWAAMRSVTGLSARAAFSAATRGGYRAARTDGDGSGELAPGAPATFVIWALSGELVVDAPDDRVARWSTDPRAGVAGLPDLSLPDPRALRTVIKGGVAYDADELSVTTRRAVTQHAHSKHNRRT